MPFRLHDVFAWGLRSSVRISAFGAKGREVKLQRRVRRGSVEAPELFNTGLFDIIEDLVRRWIERKFFPQLPDDVITAVIMLRADDIYGISNRMENWQYTSKICNRSL